MDLDFRDAAGGVRATLALDPSNGSPTLELQDATGDDQAGPQFATLDGSGLLIHTGLAYLRGTKGKKLRAHLGLNEQGNAALTLWDKNKKSRAVLGATSLQTIKTEEVTMRPESSLVLFDKDGKVMWQAP